MTTDERIDKLASSVQVLERSVQDLERVMRQGFATLTESHVDLQRETNLGFQKLTNAMSALADHVADHETRLDNLEGK